MDPITIALGLAQFAPSLIKWISGSDKASEVAQKAVDIATAVTGKSNGAAALEELKVNPDLVIAYRKALLDQEIEFQKLMVQNATDINTTMQAETKAEHWPSYSWRPFNGFLYGGTIFAVYFLLPLLKQPVPVIPSEVWLGWSAILGVASWFRGKAQADPNNDAQVKG